MQNMRWGKDTAVCESINNNLHKKGIYLVLIKHMTASINTGRLMWGQQEAFNQSPVSLPACPN